MASAKRNYIDSDEEDDHEMVAKLPRRESSSSSSSSGSSGSDSSDEEDMSGLMPDDEHFDVSNSSNSRFVDEATPEMDLNTPEVDMEAALITAANESVERSRQEQQAQPPRSPLSTLVQSITADLEPEQPPLPENDPPAPPEPVDEPQKPPEPTGCPFNISEEESDSFDEDELDHMLDVSGVRKLEEKPMEKPIEHTERTRTYLVERGRNYFEVLPHGWVKIRHTSGMPIYMHEDTRVVSVSRPYALGKLNVRHHNIPLGAIPCLNYRKALDEEQKAETEMEQQQQQEEEGGEQEAKRPMFPRAKISTLAETKKRKSISVEEFRDYCKTLFELKEVKLKEFNSWKDKRIYQKQQLEKTKKETIAKSKTLEEPSLPDGLKLITIPIIEMQKHNETQEDTAFNRKVTKKSKREWILNPKGKSPVCILHEYLQQSIKKPPEYNYKEIDSSSTPYSATVLIDGVEYGKGVGSSKKFAKSEAARQTLEILIPEFKDALGKELAGNSNALNELPDVSYFDSLRIEDPRISELCHRVGEPSPYAILISCLQRNYGQGDTSIETSLQPKRNKRNEFTMKVNNREVSVICKNKRDGKQLASQKLLQVLHPHLTSWSSLLSLYGVRSIQAQKLKKERESEVTALQSKHSSHSSPSQAILDKLKSEMKKLAEKKRQNPELAGKLTLNPMNNGGPILQPLSKADPI